MSETSIDKKGLPIVIRAEENVSEYEGVRIYASLADRPSAADFGVGVCQVGGTTYGSDGSQWYTVGGVGRNLTIVGFGDSHMNGAMSSAQTTLSATDYIGAFSWASPRDKQWNGAGGYNDFVKADSQITLSTGAQDDPNIAQGTNTASFITDIPRLLRAAYPLGDIITANFGVGGSCAYSWAGIQAKGWIKGVSNANVGDTVTIDGVVYTFVAAAANPNEITIGATANDTVFNLLKGVNADATAATGWGAGTTRHPTVFAPQPASGQYGKIQCKLSGSAGNSITMECSSTARIGVTSGDLAVAASVNLSNGSNTSSLYSQMITKCAGITPDVIICTLGTNDAVRVGYHGEGFAAELAKLIANLKTDFPAAKLIFWKPITTTAGSEATARLTDTIVPAIAAAAAADPTTVYFIDMFTPGAGSSHVEILRFDGIHGTNYGYSVTAQLFAKKIAEVLSIN
jgi:lysophospholipase L1-like esterase